MTKPAPDRFAALQDVDRRDIALWLGWSAIAGHTFTSGRHAMRELVRHSLRAARAEWFATPRPFRKLIMLETARQMRERLAEPQGELFGPCNIS